MNPKSIDIKAALVFGWNTFRAHFGFFLKLLMCLIVIAIVPALVIGKMSVAFGPYLGVPLKFLLFVWQSILGAGTLKICLKLYDKQSVDISDLWSCLPLALDYIVVKLAFGLIVMVGLILLVIPGLIWSVQFYMASYLVVDRGSSVMQALRGSSKITYGAKWDLGVFASVVLLINFVGIFFLGIGLLITIPVTMLASVYVYRQLLGQTEASGQPILAR